MYVFPHLADGNAGARLQHRISLLQPVQYALPGEHGGFVMAFSLFRRRAEAQEAHQYGDGPFSVNGHEPLTREGRLTRSEEAKLYETAPSIIDHIPWGEYLPEHQCILLDDGVSVGAVYEIIPVGTEGRPDSRLEEIRDVVENALQDSLPELDTHQWVVQFYCQDESDLMVYMDKIRGYVKPRAQGTDFTDAWLGTGPSSAECGH
jgi:hypothetical protein